MRLSFLKAAYTAVDECCVVGNPEFAPNDNPETGALSAAYPTQPKTGLDPDFLPRCAREVRVCAFHYGKAHEVYQRHKPPQEIGAMGHPNLRCRCRMQCYCSLNLPQASRLLPRHAGGRRDDKGERWRSPQHPGSFSAVPFDKLRAGSSGLIAQLRYS
jgi:hypothetical protein